MAITIDRDFDSGGCVFTGAQDTTDTYVNTVGDYVQIRPNLTYNSQWGAWAIRLDGVLGWTATIKLNATNKYGASHPVQWMAAWSYSLHGDSWNKFDTVAESPADHFTFTNTSPFTQDSVYIAHQELFTVTRMFGRITEWLQSPYVRAAPGVEDHVLTTIASRSDNLGRTVPALPIYLFQVTDQAATGEKFCVLLMHGQHADERHAAWNFEGAMDFLLSDDAQAVRLRQQCVFTVAPYANPQGGWAAYLRSAPQNVNVDHNREWTDSTPDHDSVVALKNYYLAELLGTLQVGIDYHCRPSGSAESQMYILEDAGLYAQYADFLGARYPLDPIVNFTSESWRHWSSSAFASSLSLLLTSEEIPDYTKTLVNKRQYGAATLRALDDILQTGAIEPLLPPETPSTLYDVEWRASGGSWASLVSGTAGLTHTWNTSALAVGEYELRLRGRDPEDDATTAWVTRTITVARGIVYEGEYRVNGGTWQSMFSNSPSYQYVFDTSGIAEDAEVGFRVRATDTSDNSTGEWSTVRTVQVSHTLGTASDLLAEVTDTGTILLTWAPPHGATSQRVERRIVG